jgi:hypothetical protein
VIGGRGPNVEIHARSWFATALWLTGRWDESLEEIAAVRELLGDRRDDPPYFAMHAFGAAGMIHEARGEQAEARRLLETMAKTATSSSGRTYPRSCGCSSSAASLDRRGRSSVLELARASHRRLARGGRARRRERWLGPGDRPGDRDARAGDLGPAPLLSPAADRLTGRAALAAGEDATFALESATDGFEALGTRTNEPAPSGPRRGASGREPAGRGVGCSRARPSPSKRWGGGGLERIRRG